jgi:hypothetical protein
VCLTFGIIATAALDQTRHNVNRRLQCAVPKIVFRFRLEGISRSVGLCVLLLNHMCTRMRSETREGCGDGEELVYKPEGRGFETQ